MVESLSQGGRFPDEDLKRALSEAVHNNGVSDATIVRNRAILKLAVADNANFAGATDAPAAKQSAISAMTQALEWVPSDSFLWLGLFYLLSNETPIPPNALASLRASYKYGPNEGWIIGRRLLLAAKHGRELGPEFAPYIHKDLTLLLNGGYYAIAVDAVFNADSLLRRQMLLALTDVRPYHHGLFAKALRKRGLVDDQVPWLRLPTGRPRD